MTPRTHLILPLLLAFVPSVWHGIGSHAAAQSSLQGLIGQAYERTKQASSDEDYAAIIDLCHRARAAELTPAQSDYVRRLLGWSYNRRGESFMEQAAEAEMGGDVARASELDRLAKEDFEYSISFDESRWKSFQNRGVSHALAGEYELAVADFSRVIEMRPEHVNAWFNRAEIYYQLDKLDEAVADYTRVLEMTPDDFGAFTGRGHANFRAGRFEAALSDYDEAVRLNPGNSDAHANRGDAFQGLGMWEEAAEDFRRAIRLDGNSGRALRSAAWLMATCPEERFRNRELAIEAANKAIAESGGAANAQKLDTLAAAYANAGRFAEARMTLARAFPLAPAADHPTLQARQRLYASEKPFRQAPLNTADAAHRVAEKP